MGSHWLLNRKIESLYNQNRLALPGSENTVIIRKTTCIPPELLLAWRINLKPTAMNTFITTVIINNLAADYRILPSGRKFKAVLMQTYLANCVPCQLSLWKERGIWKTHHPLTEYVLNQFGSSIDNHL